VEVTLSLQTQQLIPVHDILLVKYIRIAQFFCPMEYVNKVRRALGQLSNISEQLLNRTINSSADLNNLIELAFDGMEAHINFNASFEIRWVNNHVLQACRQPHFVLQLLLINACRSNQSFSSRICWLENLSDNTVLIIGQTNEYGCVSVKNVRVAGLLDAFLLERNELDDLLSLGYLRKYLFILDLFDVLLLLDVGVIELE
jgi:hypothetical protein